jgi:hypothetical protein
LLSPLSSTGLGMNKYRVYNHTALHFHMTLRCFTLHSTCADPIIVNYLSDTKITLCHSFCIPAFLCCDKRMKRSNFRLYRLDGQGVGRVIPSILDQRMRSFCFRLCFYTTLIRRGSLPPFRQLSFEQPFLHRVELSFKALL